MRSFWYEAYRKQNQENQELKARLDEVEKDKQELEAKVCRLESSNAIGLAAPQIGVNKQLMLQSSLEYFSSRGEPQLTESVKRRQV